MPKIFFASDHGGYKLKKELKNHLQKKYITEDLGCRSEESCDYPDFGHSLAEKIMNEPNAVGLALCGTGLGISMVLNRHPGIRAARCASINDVKMARQHNDANVLVIGGRTTNKIIARQMVDIFLLTKFEKGRHISRIEKIDISN